ncbi:putative Glutathione S-transferase U18 [Cocos nucifera]|uniref:glutathione transferase n=1 Tax=Cocos nucifera TaxID=13894 RepID=A0A8K0IF15_COCNU|nr:putative Glutathione S-transferase U18 [Cocos nucifera]
MAAAGEEVKLVGAWASPFVMRVSIALNLKGLGYEFLQEERGKKSELLLKSNPVYKKIPVLIHNGKSICESMIILEYVDEVWASIGPSILPTDPYDRAIARFWAAYIDDKFPSSIRTLRGLNEEAKAEAAEQVTTALQILEDAFAKCSKGKGFFGGETIGYLDIAFGCYLGWIKAVEKMMGIKALDEAKTPMLVGWAERFCSDDAVKEVMPEFPSSIRTLRGLNEEAKAEAAEQVTTALQILEDAFAKCSKGKGFFGGETIGYLDIAFGCYLGWIKAVEKMMGIKALDEAKTPMLVGWAERFCSDDAVKEVMPEVDKLIEFAKKIQAIMNAAPVR